MTESAPTPPPPAKKKQRHKITPADVEAIASLIIKRRLTETEAALHLNINPAVWFNWKSKPHNQVRNNECLSRVRSAHIDALISSIDEMGDASAGKKRDWRAKAWQAERLFPDRFAQQPPPPEPLKAPVDTRTAMVWADLASALLAEPQPSVVIDAEEVRQIADKPADPTPAPAAPPPRRARSKLP